MIKAGIVMFKRDRFILLVVLQFLLHTGYSKCQTIYPVEDFDDGDQLTLFGGNWGAIDSSHIGLQNLPRQMQYDKKTGGILKLSYKNLDTKNYTGLWLSFWGLAQDPYPGLSISKYDSISFYVKGSGNSERNHHLKIELKDNTADPRVSAYRLAYQEINIADNIGEWRKITFSTDVLNFNIWRYTGTKPDTSHMKYLTIVVEGNKNSSDGTFYIDQIEFKKNQIEAMPITSDELLFGIEKKATQYFLNWHCQQNGLFYHRIPSSELFSPIATGYGLIALCIAAKNNWLPFSQCQETSLQVFDSLLKMINEQQTSNSTGYGGFFYQFLDGRGRRKDLKTRVILNDHILLLIGALVNGKYFGGKLEEKADSLWAAARWPLFIRTQGWNKDKLYYGWSSEKAEGYEVVENGRDGYFSGINQENPLNMDYYSDEKILMSILAMGSPNPQNRLDKKIFYSWSRVKAQSGNLIQSWNGSLDDFTLSLLFLNYRQLGYDLHYKSEWQINWLENARTFASLVQKYPAYDNPFNSFWWGTTACESFAESKADSITFINFGLEPNGREEKITAGTFAPHTLCTSLALGDNFQTNGIDAIKNLYSDKYLFGSLYGFYESANFSFKGQFLDGWFNRAYLSFHVGQIMVSLENYLTGKNSKKSGFIQNLFMQKTEPVLRELFSFLPDVKPEIPESFFTQVFPNPFQRKTAITYSLPYSLPITIRIFNMLGQELKEYSESMFKQAGKYIWHWEPDYKLSSGIYFWTIEYNQMRISKKLIYLQ